MSAFADSSALVKLYADEPSHEVVRGLDVLVVSALARVEVPAALWRKQRIGELAADDAGLLVQAFEADFDGAQEEPATFAVIAASGEILERAAGLAATEGLRTYDGVQLASALAARAADPSCTSFACFDRALCDAAARHGFALVA